MNNFILVCYAMVKLVQTVIDISKMLNTRKYELESNRVDKIFFRYPTIWQCGSYYPTGTTEFIRFLERGRCLKQTVNTGLH